MLRCKCFPVNPLEENCYVVSDDSGEAVIIDCGAWQQEEFDAIAEYMAEEHLKPVAHLLTHAHFDHIFGAPRVFIAYGLRPRCHVADAPLYSKMRLQVAALMNCDFSAEMPPLGEPLVGGCQMEFGHHALTVIETPGHTQGGVCLYEEQEHVLFSGDSLFRMSIGRTDLPGGDYYTLMDSLTRLFGLLPSDVTIYTGHGPATSSTFERAHNPYI